jgi:hypothetical protein
VTVNETHIEDVPQVTTVEKTRIEDVPQEKNLNQGFSKVELKEAIFQRYHNLSPRPRFLNKFY